MVVVKMKAISLMQPWAQAIFLNLKHYETRPWSTKYRGPLLIHASKGFPAYAREFASTELALGRGIKQLPFGAIIGRVYNVAVWETAHVALKINALEKLYGDYSVGRYAWEFANPILFNEPIPYKGSLGLFNVSDDILPIMSRKEREQLEYQRYLQSDNHQNYMFGGK